MYALAFSLTIYCASSSVQGTQSFSGSLYAAYITST
nr:MAG TPA: hypothetical protein [Caudoviricetes sp.]